MKGFYSLCYPRCHEVDKIKETPDSLFNASTNPQQPFLGGPNKLDTNCPPHANTFVEFLSKALRELESYIFIKLLV